MGSAILVCTNILYVLHRCKHVLLLYLYVDICNMPNQFYNVHHKSSYILTLFLRLDIRVHLDSSILYNCYHMCVYIHPYNLDHIYVYNIHSPNPNYHMNDNDLLHQSNVIQMSF